ncbi:tripartite tricarboxylate transporter substrate binding protein [Rhodoplanes sp. TEM]|uniref:Tripartite tricarboxylate transporter substrate binding protein n=1 Tax=Rhodoplanes tepidamans TaxID=200616 RepID=A0ABT5J8Z9_RHOTP|nr:MULTISPECIES: tripartite tricarboxylate transporter substrate binding protein [Rhodoplanes]MDC7786133.1 tripartite tricarboxylate transporter substrate binding protein [Rhodoplanes tepidamans]MDC7982800.1 tripartite tricarboxylate transporter substrate binding protein [Rhodoplanes sp. TEM]MDQ0357202.1 tripartite-type tricarboxylate transporter receptor subunit TctC [Rhodoplanes tepidamans]
MRLTRTTATTFRLFGAAAAAGLLLSLPSPAHAEFPEKTIEMTTLFGGPAQTISQVLADLMSKNIGQPVITVSRPGGGGAIGYTFLQSAAPDGYSIVFSSNSISTVYYQGNLPFNYSALAPVAQIGMEVPVLAVRADSGWKDLKALQDAGKASGKKLRVGVSGLGTFTHLASAALFNRLGLQVVYIPYGEGRAPAELLGGRIDAALQWASQFAPHVKAGTINVLCMTSKEKVDLPVDTVTCDSAGAKGLDLTIWRGIHAPKDTPPAVIAKLEASIKQAVESPDFKKAGDNLGFSPLFKSAKDFGAMVAENDKEIGELMTELGINKKKK